MNQRLPGQEEKDSVQEDDILAENKPFIKWFKTGIRSPITGKVESISTITGQILLREPPRVLELRGYIDGVVAEVHTEQGVTVESTCSLVQGIFGIGGETSGELVMGVKAPDQPLLPEQLNASMKGRSSSEAPFSPRPRWHARKNSGSSGWSSEASTTRTCARCSAMIWALRLPARSKSASR